MALPKMKKLYYSISEVSRTTDVSQPTLRYWENEFSFLQPGKNSAGNRIYKASDIKLVLLIKYLLYTQKLTINGAIDYIQDLHEKNILNQTLDEFNPQKPDEEKKRTVLSVQTEDEENETNARVMTEEPGVVTLLIKIKDEIDTLIHELETIHHKLD